MRTRSGVLWGLFATLAMLATLLTSAAAAHPDTDDGGPDSGTDSGLDHPHPAGDLSAPLAAHDASTADVISSGPMAKVTKNIVARSIGERDVPQATTDVWAHDGYAYTGTFNAPCNTPEAGIWVWDVSNKNKAEFVTIIQSEAGDRTNDVRVASMNSGDILVMSNESCGGGNGGFEIYDVDDPTNPQLLARVVTDDVNVSLQSIGFTEFGVHNLFLFTQGSKDYVAATVESEFGNFQIFDITDPTAPVGPVGWWGAEQIDPANSAFPAPHPFEDYSTLDFFDPADEAIILAADAYLFSGFGASQNRFLHDITISADGTLAYLANWDAGLVLLDISDVTSPTLVSVALDETSEDGEVNSHSVWPSEDGTIVIEGEEDFSPFELAFSIDGPNAGSYPAAEGAITVPIFAEPGQTMSGVTRYVGFGCEGSVFAPGPPFDIAMPTADDPSEIALIQRGGCFFSEKIDNAEAAGYAGVVVFNNAVGGNALVSMGGAPTNLPGIFVGHDTGLAIMDVATAGDLVLDTTGATATATAVPNGWSGFRIWDYSDPTSPSLEATFNTVCSADPIDPSCDPAGTYSSHNVIVETTGNKVKAYISWYNDGMLILDISDPANPVEIGRYTEDDTDFWGVYKEPNSPFFYGSDRNGGLYVFKEQGAGSGKSKP